MKNLKYVVAVLLLVLVIAAVALTRPTEDGRSPTSNVGNTTVSVPYVNGPNIQLTSPKAGEAVGPLVTITGFARVFENQFNYQILDSDGTVLAEGRSMSDAEDAGLFGAFTITAEIAPVSDHGTIEVFDYSAKDGSKIDLASVSVNFIAAPSGS